MPLQPCKVLADRLEEAAAMEARGRSPEVHVEVPVGCRLQPVEPLPELVGPDPELLRGGVEQLEFDLP